MSSVLAAFARGAPKAVGLMAGSGASVRATRIRSVRALSAGPLSGLSRPSQHKDSGLSRPSALAPATRGSIQQQRQQQSRRWMSIETADKGEGSDEALVEGVSEDAHGEVMAEQATAEAGEATEASGPVGAAAEPAVVKEEGNATAPAGPPRLAEVNGIPFTMMEDELKEWFAEMGCPVVKVTMPLWSGESMRAGQNKGRAFVEMATEEDTQTVLSLNGRSIGERWISISRLSTTLEECRVVSMRGVKDFTEADLMELFMEFDVRPVHIKILDSANRGMGIAFIKFETPAEAIKALEVDGKNVMNQWMNVSLHFTKHRTPESRLGVPSEPPFGPDAVSAQVVLLKGLPFTLSNDEIVMFLRQYGIMEEDILEMKVPKYNDTQFNTGLAHLYLKDAASVEKALALRGSYIGDRWVDVVLWEDRDKRPTNVSHKDHIENSRTAVPAELKRKYPDLPCVALSGLPFQRSKAEMIEYLEENGVPQSTMEEMQMPLYMQTQNNTGSCWVVINEEQAYNRLMELNGAIIDDRWVTITDA